MPQISVIMPICNTKPDYLKQAISSILKQTFSDFEFLILNDSPDNSDLDKVIESFNDRRIRYTKSNQNLGVAESHNKLLSMATGRYIALMDHDDVALPNRLQKQYDYMEAHKEVGLCGSAYKRFGRITKIKTIVNPQEHEDIQAMLLFACPIHHPSSMIRKSVLDENHICYDNKFISLNDRKLYLDISRCAKLHNLPDVLYKYRMHPMMTSKVRHKDIAEEQLIYRQSLLDEYNIDLSTEDKNILNAYILNGRCRIKSIKILEQIMQVLEKLVKANERHKFSDQSALKAVCGRYLIRRCKNAAVAGRISSESVLKQTSLPIKIPLWLKIFNIIRGVL